MAPFHQIESALRRRARFFGIGAASPSSELRTRMLIKDGSSELRMFMGRARVLLAGALVLTLILVARLLHLQVLQHEHHQTRSEENRMQMVPVPPVRGLIFDRQGNLLAENRPIFNLALIRERIEDLDGLIDALAAVTSISDEEIEDFHDRLKRTRRPFEPVVLKFALTDEEVAALAVDRHRFLGAEISVEIVRHYPYGALAAHAIGSVRRITKEDLDTLDRARYSGTNFIGKRGVERFYEHSLHGEVGTRWVETDAFGRVRRTLDVSPTAVGHNLQLHLDIGLQAVADEALGDRRGAVVAIDPRSGGVLALVSKPTYDPNLFVTGIDTKHYRALVGSRDKPLVNRAINGQYAPGSTIKPILGLAGLTHGAVDWEEEIVDPGWFRLPGGRRLYRDWNWTPSNPGGQGIVNLNRAIYRSSNIFFYTLGHRLEANQLAGFIRQFGYGEVISVDVDGAAAGLVPDPVWKRAAKGEPWYPGDNVNMGIGQGDLLVTPMQAAAATSILANRGNRVRPRLMLAGDQSLLEDELRSLPPVAGPSADDWERMVDAMEDVVHRGDKGYLQNGTAWFHIGRDIDYRMAGKSGTAQVVEIKQGEAYDEDELDEYNRKHAWFIAFAPADAPAIAVSVLVENGGGGSSVAAPIARQVVDAYLSEAPSAPGGQLASRLDAAQAGNERGREALGSGPPWMWPQGGFVSR